MALFIDQDVIGLQISVNEVHSVHGVHGQNDLRRVKLGLLLRHHVLLDQQGHQVSPLQKLHHQVKVLLVRERAAQVHDPRVHAVRQNVSLSQYVRDLFLLHHLSLVHLLYSH